MTTTSLSVAVTDSATSLIDRPAADQVAALGSVLGIWAHPDDEAYLSGGLMSLATAAGQRVVHVTATLGELGTDDPARWPPERLATLRRIELEAALAAVGVSEHHVLGHRDGTLGSTPVDPAVAQIGRLLDAVRPDTVVTFGPDGMTGHDDHRAVSDWVRRAWERNGRHPRLLQATTTEAWAERFAEVNDVVGAFAYDQELPVRRRHDSLGVHLELPDAVLDRKVDALRAHASQTGPLERMLGSDLYRAWWATESFVEV
jgi:LmbE family N-acetylglucosaminyl deacetylase